MIQFILKIPIALLSHLDIQVKDARLSCIFSTDMGGDSSATTLWACLSLLRKKTISQGFASTTTSANF
jgi:hypothetical protein